MGIKVMKPGHDATDNDFHDIAYSSDDIHINVKVNQTPQHYGVVSYTFTAAPPDPALNATTNTMLTTIPHGLGYVPASSVFALITAPDNGNNMIPQGSYYPLPVTLNLASAGVSFSKLGYYCDSQNMVIYYSVTKNANASQDPTGLAITFKYYIFASPGA